MGLPLHILSAALQALALAAEEVFQTDRIGAVDLFLRVTHIQYSFQRSETKKAPAFITVTIADAQRSHSLFFCFL